MLKYCQIRVFSPVTAFYMNNVCNIQSISNDIKYFQYFSLVICRTVMVQADFSHTPGPGPGPGPVPDSYWNTPPDTVRSWKIGLQPVHLCLCPCPGSSAVWELLYNNIQAISPPLSRFRPVWIHCNSYPFNKTFVDNTIPRTKQQCLTFFPPQRKDKI